MTSDAGKKPNPAIAMLAINLCNGLHITSKGLSFEEFITFAKKTEGLMFALTSKSTSISYQGA